MTDKSGCGSDQSSAAQGLETPTQARVPLHALVVRKKVGLTEHLEVLPTD
jgi:hypothetical protein